MSKQDPWYWYKWFPRDYMTSPKVMALTWEEQGIYRFLLDFQWINEGIPADLSKCCAIVRGAKRKSVENVVTTFFTAHPDRSDLLVNERLLSCQRDNQRISKKNSEAGKASGESRKRGTPVEQPVPGISSGVSLLA